MNLSHDFRTPLAVVRSEVELLRQRLDGQELRAALDRIDTNAGAIVELIEQLLELARLDAAKTPISRVACDLCAVAREVRAQLQPARGDIEVVLRAPERPILALVDALHFRRILQNLLANALRELAGSGGRVTVTIGAEPGWSSDRGRVRYRPGRARRAPRAPVRAVRFVPSRGQHGVGYRARARA